jgi:hypothetical protein
MESWSDGVLEWSRGMSEDILTRVQRNRQRLGDGAIKWGDVEGEATREAPGSGEASPTCASFPVQHRCT